ncbi:MAG: hypothetical protein ACIAQU_05850 [Phycisphaerales bacterium JB064]
MPDWVWIILAFMMGAIIVAVVVPRLAGHLRSTPPPDLPEELAPGWHAQCTRCGRTKTLASVGGIRMGANRGAHKATLGWCKGCRRLRIVRVVHESGLEPVPTART